MKNHRKQAFIFGGWDMWILAKLIWILTTKIEAQQVGWLKFLGSKMCFFWTHYVQHINNCQPRWSFRPRKIGSWLPSPPVFFVRATKNPQQKIRTIFEATTTPETFQHHPKETPPSFSKTTFRNLLMLHLGPRYLSLFLWAVRWEWQDFPSTPKLQLGNDQQIHPNLHYQNDINCCFQQTPLPSNDIFPAQVSGKMVCAKPEKECPKVSSCNCCGNFTCFFDVVVSWVGNSGKMKQSTT